jgi:hypothetical protein
MADDVVRPGLRVGPGASSASSWTVPDMSVSSPPVEAPDHPDDGARERATTCEDTMPPKAKSILIWVVVIFLVYAVITSPERAADVVRALWDLVTAALAGFGRFFDSLTS